MVKKMDLEDVRQAIEDELSDRLSRCGLMYRLFGRVKTVRSLAHKFQIKGEKYRSGRSKVQDVIGLRIVLYFPDDVELLGMFFSFRNLVDASVDNLAVDTFRPQRLNLVKRIPDHLVAPFLAALPAEYADYIDATYEVQIRTIFSEGWHEVEHDMRYKCQDDWAGCDAESRALNGIIASLETAEYSMSSIFRELSLRNLELGKYNSMLRNKLRIRLADDGFSDRVSSFLTVHPEVAEALFRMDRMVFLVTLLHHSSRIPLTYDNILFLANRFDIQNVEVMGMEDEATRQLLDRFVAS